MDTPHASRGFSLIELTVVAAIIAVLAALLLPAMGLVQASARTAMCLSNLRQIGMAQLGYANDNNGFLCPTDGFGWWDQSQYWNRGLVDYTDDNANRQNRGNHIASVSWGCPEWRLEEFIAKAKQADYWSYLYLDGSSGYGMAASFQPGNVGSNDKIENGWWYIDNNRYVPVDATATARWNARFTDPHPLLARMAQIPWLSRQLLVCDGYQHFFHGWYQAYASASGRKLVIERHRGKGGMLYCDGSTGLLTGEEWNQAFWRPDR